MYLLYAAADDVLERTGSGTSCERSKPLLIIAHSSPLANMIWLRAFIAMRSALSALSQSPARRNGECKTRELCLRGKMEHTQPAWSRTEMRFWKIPMIMPSVPTRSDTLLTSTW